MKPHLLDTLFLQTTSSTNSYLSDLLSQGTFPHGYCVCSRFQSAGRGQAGNIWESADGENLLFSLLLHTQKFPLDRQFLLSEVVSIAICRFLSRYQISARIKYPNDIFVGDKKIAGILIENRIVGKAMQYSIVGIGLNVNQEVFIQNKATATSMRSITGERYHIDALLQSLRHEILDRVDGFSIENKSECKELYFSLLYRCDGYYPYEADGVRFDAKIVDIADDGMLHLTTDKGEERKYYFKQVRFII